MTAATIKFHAAAIARDTAEMEAAYAANRGDEARMIWDAIKFRREMLAKRGVVIV
jgi:hypothetical protein